MSILATAQQAVAAHLAGYLECDPIKPQTPLNPIAGAAYVWPGDPWISAPVGGSFCDIGEVTLVADIVAGTVELPKSEEWLADRVEELWRGASSGIPLAGDTVTPVSADRPGLVQTVSGATFLVVRVTFTPFRLET